MSKLGDTCPLEGSHLVQLAAGSVRGGPDQEKFHGEGPPTRHGGTRVQPRGQGLGQTSRRGASVPPEREAPLGQQASCVPDQGLWGRHRGRLNPL